MNNTAKIFLFGRPRILIFFLKAYVFRVIMIILTSLISPSFSSFLCVHYPGFLGEAPFLASHLQGEFLYFALVQETENFASLGWSEYRLEYIIPIIYQQCPDILQHLEKILSDTKSTEQKDFISELIRICSSD